jgi:hypothetical protein
MRTIIIYFLLGLLEKRAIEGHWKERESSLERKRLARERMVKGRKMLVMEKRRKVGKRLGRIRVKEQRGFLIERR